eukprot:gene4045-4595_t
MPSQHGKRQSMQPEVFVVDLPKIKGSFGLGFTGGPEVAGIFVKALQAGGAAAQDGRIQKGDRLVEINGRRMDGYSKHDAVEMLKSSVGMATLIFERYGYQFRQLSSQMSSFDGDCVAVELQKKNDSFGLCVTGGAELGGIYVKYVLQGGASDGKICRGDKIVEMNGISMDGFSKPQCDEIFKKSPKSILLMVERLRSVEDMPSMDGDLFSVELRRGDAGLGITLTGGIEMGGIFIKGIMPESQAEQSDRISRGDRIVEINGVSVEGLTKHQAMDLMKRSKVINLLLERNAVFDGIVIPESDFFTLELMKKNNSFGMNLSGGPEVDGIFVKSLQSGGSASDDGRIQKGDRVAAINGKIIEGMTKQQASEKLKSSVNKVVLYLERCTVGYDVPPLDTVLTVVDLAKAAGSFGLSLTGGPEAGGIFIRAMLPGGSAEIDGRIQLGDKVTEINGISLDGCSKLQAIDILKSCPQNATFILERYKVSPRRLAQRDSSARSGTSGSVAFSLSQQSLSQSRSSIQSFDSQLSQSTPPVQIPSYCTLPRQQVPGQSQSLSAFHPVVSRSLPGTPTMERRGGSNPGSQGQITSQRPQVRGQEFQHQQAKGQQRSASQPSSPTRVVNQQMVKSIYGVKSSNESDADAPVKVLQTGSGATGQTGPISEPTNVSTRSSAIRSQSANAGLQWIPLAGDSPAKQSETPDRERGSTANRSFTLERSLSSDRGTALLPTSSSTMPRQGSGGGLLKEVRVTNSNSVYTAAQGGQDVQTLPRTFGRQTMDGVVSDGVGSRMESYGSSTSIYAKSSKSGISSADPSVNTIGSQSMQNLSYQSSASKPGNALPKASALAMATEPRSMYALQTNQNRNQAVTSLPFPLKGSSTASVAPAMYATGQRADSTHAASNIPHSATSATEQARLSTSTTTTAAAAPERGRPKDFYSDVIKPQSGLMMVGSGQGAASLAQSLYNNSIGAGDKQQGVNSSAQNRSAGRLYGSAVNAQAVGPSNPPVPPVRTTVNKDVPLSVRLPEMQRQQQQQQQRSNISSSRSSGQSGIGMAHQNAGVAHQNKHQNQGLLSMSAVPQNTRIVSRNESAGSNSSNNQTSSGVSSSPTWSDQRMKQYPPPPLHAMQQHRQQADYNQNEVRSVADSMKQNGSGRVYQNAPPPPKPAARKSSTGFSPFADSHVFEVLLYKGPVGLGMSLYGGASEGPVRIKKIAKGSSADESGQLQAGDFLLEVNGISVEKMSSKDVVSILRSSPNEILLLVKRQISVDRNAYQSSTTYVGL